MRLLLALIVLLVGAKTQTAEIVAQALEEGHGWLCTFRGVGKSVATEGRNIQPGKKRPGNDATSGLRERRLIITYCPCCASAIAGSLFRLPTRQ